MIRLSLNRKMIGLVLAGIVGVMISAGIQFRQTLQTLQQHENQRIREISGGITEEISAQLYERYGDVQAFATNYALQIGDAEEAAKSLDQYVKLYGVYDLILITKLDGTYFSSNQNDSKGKPIEWKRLKGANFSQEAWFKPTLERQWTKDERSGYDGSYVGEPENSSILEKLTGSKKWTVTFSTLINDENGKAKYLLTNYSNSTWVSEAFSNAVRTARAQNYSHVDFALIGPQGKVYYSYHGLADSEKEDSRIEADINAYELLKGTAPELGTKAGDLILNARSLNREDPHVLGYETFENTKANRSLGWKVLTFVDQSEATATVSKLSRRFFGGALVATLILGLIATAISVATTRPLQQNVQKLGEEMHAVRNGIEILSSSSKQLAVAASQQAASIQESVSAIGEISSMINETTEGSKRSLSASEVALDATKVGKEIMGKMRHAMVEIESSSANLTRINEMIKAINTKTSVINDIVFKTQLLSFNASIEAARAGQAGKGFSVVAEEVGNLARMSGAAAEDIETLLADSQKNVEMAIDSTAQKVIEAKIISDRAIVTYDDISGSVGSMNDRLKGIVEAAAQQALGVEQIELALKQVDTATAQNQQSSISVRDGAQNISESNSRLNSIFSNLTREIGKTGGTSHSSAQLSGWRKFFSGTNLTNSVKAESKGESTILESPSENNVVPLFHESNKDSPAANDPSFKRMTG
jgi:methyl-accepting chemotaxis protein